MKNCKLYNIDKDRKATANEVAKSLLLSKIDEICVLESFGCEDMTEEEVTDVMKFYNQHVDAIQKRFNYLYLNIK